MLKKCSKYILAFFFCICITVSPTFAMAAETNSTVSIVELENGDRIEIETTIIPSYHRSTMQETAAKRVFSYINFLGDTLFSYTLYGEFEYDGQTSRATYVDFGIDIYDAGWDVETHSEYISGNSVRGSAKFNGPLFRTETLSGGITCDKNGKII